MKVLLTACLCSYRSSEWVLFLGLLDCQVCVAHTEAFRNELPLSWVHMVSPAWRGLIFQVAKDSFLSPDIFISPPIPIPCSWNVFLHKIGASWVARSDTPPTQWGARSRSWGVESQVGKWQLDTVTWVQDELVLPRFTDGKVGPGCRWLA